MPVLGAYAGRIRPVTHKTIGPAFHDMRNRLCITSSCRGHIEELATEPLIVYAVRSTAPTAACGYPLHGPHIHRNVFRNSSAGKVGLCSLTMPTPARPWQRLCAGIFEAVHGALATCLVSLGPCASNGARPVVTVLYGMGTSCDLVITLLQL